MSPQSSYAGFGGLGRSQPRATNCELRVVVSTFLNPHRTAPSERRLRHASEWAIRMMVTARASIAE